MPPAPRRAPHAAARAHGARAPPAERLPARRRRRARRRAPRDVRRQARRRPADRRPRALGRHRRRVDRDRRRSRGCAPARPPASSARSTRASWPRRGTCSRACASSTRSSAIGPGLPPDDHLDPAMLNPLVAPLPARGVPRRDRGAAPRGPGDRGRAGVRDRALMARARPSTAAAHAYADARARRRDGPDWREASWAVVDLETTGLDPAQDEIVSVAVMPVDDGRITPGRRPLPARAARPRARRRTRSGSTASARPTSRARRRSTTSSTSCSARSPAGSLVAHAAFVERGFLEPALATRGVAAARTGSPTRGRSDASGWPSATTPSAPAQLGLTRPGRAARPARAPPAPRARRRADDGAGVPRARDAPGAARAPHA